jgi:pyridoxal-phosphate dependent enzyme
MAETKIAVSWTPVENREGRWYKREDRYRLVNGCNGAKLRACRWLLTGARDRGAERVVSAASVLSPQSAMAASLATELGMESTIIIGGSKPKTALRHTSIRVAKAAGAEIRHIPVGYNPALQKAAAAFTAENPSTYWLRYGITPPPDMDVEGLRGFHETSGDQVGNIPAGVETLVLPFGSGNTGAGVLYGLALQTPPDLKRVVLMVIGPDRQRWLRDRLEALGTPLDEMPFELERLVLHGTFATYGDRMPETEDGIVMHPTYEGKVVRYLNQERPEFWRRRDDTTCMWIVGGPLRKAKGAAS